MASGACEGRSVSSLDDFFRGLAAFEAPALDNCFIAWASSLDNFFIGFFIFSREKKWQKTSLSQPPEQTALQVLQAQLILIVKRVTGGAGNDNLNRETRLMKRNARTGSPLCKSGMCCCRWSMPLRSRRISRTATTAMRRR